MSEPTKEEIRRWREGLPLRDKGPEVDEEKIRKILVKGFPSFEELKRESHPNIVLNLKLLVKATLLTAMLREAGVRVKEEK